jgi:transcriptional regulator with XRE-family HTH domain
MNTEAVFAVPPWYVTSIAQENYYVNRKLVYFSKFVPCVYFQHRFFVRNSQRRVMFYSVFKDLCNKNGETPNAVAVKLGFSQAAAPYWKKSEKAPKREGLEKIAEYFGVSVDYLLEKEKPQSNIIEIPIEIAEIKNAPTKPSRSELFTILGKLTDSELDEVLDFAEYLLLKRNRVE